MNEPRKSDIAREAFLTRMHGHGKAPRRAATVKPIRINTEKQYNAAVKRFAKIVDRPAKPTNPPRQRFTNILPGDDETNSSLGVEGLIASTTHTPKTVQQSHFGRAPRLYRQKRGS